MTKRGVYIAFALFMSVPAWAAYQTATQPEPPAPVEIPKCPASYPGSEVPSTEKPKDDLPWVAAGITDGRPYLLRAIRGEEKEEGRRYTETFRHLDKHEFGSYLVCQYGFESGVNLSKPLPASVTTCTMQYEQVGDTNRYQIQTMSCS